MKLYLTKIPQCVSSPRGSTVPIIATDNALGNNKPLYTVFSGSSWNEAFLQDASLGSSGEMSKNWVVRYKCITQYI